MKHKKPSPPSSDQKLSTDAEQLVRLANATAQAGSRSERQFWEQRLLGEINELFANDAEDDLANALDFLYDTEADSYNEIVDLAESCAESISIEREGETFDVLLIVIPTLAWSRFPIPSGLIEASIVNTFRTQAKTHLLAKNAAFALCDFLHSPDQLPRSYIDTLKLTQALGQAALDGNNRHLDPETQPETNLFLSDARMLIGAIAVRRGQPYFCWQENGDRGDRETALRQWSKNITPSLQTLLAGSSFQPLLINAYHVACRQADQASRAYSLQASVLFLQSVWEIAPETLRCVIGAFHDKELEEYRISFLNADRSEVIHGVVWPLADAEEEGNGELIVNIEETLRTHGIKNIVSHDQHFPMEYCEDCGAPMFPNLDGELVHTETPEHMETGFSLLH